MFSCPACRKPLDRVKIEQGLVWACQSCGGHASTVTILRKNIDGPFVSRLWTQVVEGRWLRERPDRPCPACAKPMGEITEETVTGPVEIDVCRPCQFFWFDLGETEQLPAAAVAEPGAKSELDPRVREAVALAEIEIIRKRYENADLGSDVPDAWWKVLATIVGLPVKEGGASLLRKPLLTWGISLLILVASLVAFRSLDAAVAEWGFVPADPMRHGGLTIFSSFLLHGGWFHLLGNLYFLLVFGDEVEDLLGHAKFFLLLVAATLCGSLCHLAADPSSTVPSIGASGGIAGVLAFYALAFPRARIGLMVRYGWFGPTLRGGWIRLTAAWAFVMWLGVQAFGTWQQLSGFGGVNYLAHLGGAAAGALGFVYWKVRNLR